MVQINYMNYVNHLRVDCGWSNEKVIAYFTYLKQSSRDKLEYMTKVFYVQNGEL